MCFYPSVILLYIWAHRSLWAPVAIGASKNKLIYDSLNLLSFHFLYTTYHMNHMVWSLWYRLYLTDYKAFKYYWCIQEYLVWHKNGLNPNHQYDSVSLLSLLVTILIFALWYLQNHSPYEIFLLRSFVLHDLLHKEPQSRELLQHCRHTKYHTKDYTKYYTTRLTPSNILVPFVV